MSPSINEAIDRANLYRSEKTFSTSALTIIVLADEIERLRLAEKMRSNAAAVSAAHMSAMLFGTGGYLMNQDGSCEHTPIDKMYINSLVSPQVTDEQIAFANITKSRVIAELDRVADVYGLDIRDKREAGVVEEAVWLVWRALLSAPPAAETLDPLLRAMLEDDIVVAAAPQEAKPVAADGESIDWVLWSKFVTLREMEIDDVPVVDLIPKIRDILAAAPQEQAPKTDRDIYMICNSYESGFGHGAKKDGLDLSRTPHADPEHGEAYQIGYEAGERRSQEQAPADKDAISVMLSDTEALEGIAAWLETQELTVNVGQVQGDFDEHLESSAGWLLRLVNTALQSQPQQVTKHD